MSHKTTATLDAHTKQLGFCAIHVASGEYMDVPGSIHNRAKFEKFIGHLNVKREMFRITEIILDD